LITRSARNDAATHQAIRNRGGGGGTGGGAPPPRGPPVPAALRVRAGSALTPQQCHAPAARGRARPSRAQFHKASRSNSSDQRRCAAGEPRHGNDQLVRLVDTDVLRVAVEEQGPAGGRPILLLHGWPDAPRGWGPVARRLQERGWRTIVPARVARVRLGSVPRRRRGTDAGSRLPVTRSTSWTHSASTVSPSSATTGAHASPTRWPRSRRSARRDRRARASLSARGVFTVPAFQLREDRCLDPRNGEPVRDATRPPPGRGVRGRRRGLKRVRAGRPSAR
jgi:hypothetical protein